LENQIDPARQQEILLSYFEKLKEIDLQWSIYLLQNNPIKRIRSGAELLKIAQTQIDFSDEIFEACLNMSTDNLEAISLVLPVTDSAIDISLRALMQQLGKVAKKDKKNQSDDILSMWAKLRIDERYIFNKLLTNTLKSPISDVILHHSLCRHLNCTVHEIAIQLYDTSGICPTPVPKITNQTSMDSRLLRPLPFQGAIEHTDLQMLDDPSNYSLSCEWNGVRVQFVKGKDDYHIWSRRGELLTSKFPEFQSLADNLAPATIIDGLLIAHKNQVLLPKSAVRKRIARKRATPKLIQEIPVIFCAIDLLQVDHGLLTHLGYSSRQDRLEQIIRHLPDHRLIQLSDELQISDWKNINAVFDEIKSFHSHALILKSKDQPYHSGDPWYKIKAAHPRVKGILLYAKRGDGSLSHQLVEFTLAARSGASLIPFARVPVTFMDEENLEIRAFVKDHTIERFGPVYSLEAKLVFEISFESIEISKRHKCGFVLRKINFVKWHRDDNLEDVVQLDDLIAMLA
jgi:DNA ligase-1